MKVVFLDIDGVINDDKTIHDAWVLVGRGELEKDPSTKYPPGPSMISSNMVAHVKAIIDATDAKIVISSTWRRSHTLQELIAFLEQKGLVSASKCVIGITPGDDSIPRGYEIEAWLHEHPEVESYVVLDDNYILPKEMRNRDVAKRHVKTTYETWGIPKEEMDYESPNLDWNFASYPESQLRRGGLNQSHVDRAINLLKMSLRSS
jgi:hypothetical protein